MSRHTAGSLVIAGCALSWGLIGIIVREVPLPALTIVASRVLLSAVAIAAILLVSGRARLLARPSPAVVALGVLLAVHWGLYFSAIKETSVASAVLITYAAPIFMAFLAAALIRERVPPATIAALAISLAGIATISLAGGQGGGEVRPLGVALAVGAAISYALLVVLLKKWAAEIHPITVVVYQDATAAVLLAPALALASYDDVALTDVAYLLVLGIVLTGLAGTIYVAALRWVPATTAGILAYMEPVSAALLAAALLGEPLTPAVMAGGVAIVAAGVLVVLASPEPVPAAVEEPLAGVPPALSSEPAQRV